MKILLIYPYTFHRQTRYQMFYPRNEEMWLKHRRRESGNLLVFRILTSLTPKKYEIEIIDDMIDIIDYNINYNLVGISSETMNIIRAYEISDEFRRRNIPVVIGGAHATALPNEVKEHADSVVIGEAEELWPQLVKDLEKNNLKPFYIQKKPLNKNLYSQIKIDRKFFKGSSISQRLLATRGCPNHCEYCAISNNPYSALFRKRPINDIIEEIESIPQKFLIFDDASLTIDPIYTKKLFRQIKNLNKKFFCNGNIDILSRDKELIRLAAEAGCISWCIGFESISQKIIDIIGKKTNKVNEYLKGIKQIHDYGMCVEGAFIFGFDSDKPTIFDDTFNAIQCMELDIGQFNILTPYPGTPLFNRFEKENRILTKDWSKYDLINHVVFQPKNMSPQELLEGTQLLYKKFYSSKLTIKRILKNIRFDFFTSTFITRYNILNYLWSRQFYHP